MKKRTILLVILLFVLFLWFIGGSMPLGDSWNRIDRHKTSKMSEYHSLAGSTIVVINGGKFDNAFMYRHFFL